MTEPPVRPDGESTRERMLRAATERFARQSYDRTGLRQIAADAGVDVAYLHRSFGSKERLFAEVLRRAIASERIVPDGDGPAPAGAAEIAGLLAGRYIERAQQEDLPAVIAIIVQSLGCPEALPLVRAAIHEMFAGPLNARLGPDHEGRVALLSALLIGLAVGRSAIGFDSLSPPQREDLRTVAAGLIRRVLVRREG